MHRVLGASTFLAIALAMPMQDAAAQDPIGGAILGGAAGAIIGGAVGGGRGAATGAIIGGVTGAAIAAQGQPRPGGYSSGKIASDAQLGGVNIRRPSSTNAESPSPLALERLPLLFSNAGSLAMVAAIRRAYAIPIF